MSQEIRITHHYIEYEFPFCFELKKMEIEVERREITTNIPFERIPIRFRFFDKDEVIQGDERYVGEKKCFSNTYYVGKLDIKQKDNGENARYCCCSADGRVIRLKEYDIVVDIEAVYDFNSCKV